MTIKAEPTASESSKAYVDQAQLPFPFLCHWSACCLHPGLSFSQVLHQLLQAFQVRSVQLLRHVQLSATPWTAACQAYLSITNSWSLLKLVSIESVMPSNHLIPCCALLLSPLIFPSIKVFSSESVLRIRWPKYWSFSFSISPSNEYSGLISFRMDWLDPLAWDSQEYSSFNTTVQKHQFFSTQLSLQFDSHIHT